LFIPRFYGYPGEEEAFWEKAMGKSDEKILMLSEVTNFEVQSKFFPQKGAGRLGLKRRNYLSLSFDAFSYFD